MKKFTFLLLFAVNTVLAQAQPAIYLWPIQGAEPGTGILYPPQSYIDNELNFSSLFLTAPEGTAVLSPVDGVIESLGAEYQIRFSHVLGYNYAGNFNETIRQARAELDNTQDPRFLAGSISIRATDGKIVSISGLTGEESFKTGQRIARGTTIGRMGYSYYQIREPSIEINISENKRAYDPMGPFGIKTTFIPTEEVRPVLSLSKAEAKEDYRIYIDALKELVPGLYHSITPEELDAYVDQVMTQIDSYPGDLDFADFWKIMRLSQSKIHDTHITLFQPVWYRPTEPPMPQIWFGWISGELICTNAIEGYEDLIGRPITRINGIAADSIKSIISSLVFEYDGKVEGYTDLMLATTGFVSFLHAPYWDGRSDMEIEWANGEKSEISVVPILGRARLAEDWSRFMRLNRHPEGYDLRMLNDSTAYFGLSNFELHTVAVEEIARFIDSIADTKNLIIDLRNNRGGDIEVLSKLYSYIAGEPLMLDGYWKVNKKGGFDSFRYSLNYYGSLGEVFPEYTVEEGKEGFYLRSLAENTIVPDSSVNYKGRVYVLINEYSISAATAFPAMVVRNHRGVIVGRETRGAYHFMNADKFADIRLPHSTITVKMPLTEIVFDTVVNERVPFGRGVLPDYPVPLTLDELTFKNGDAVLNYTLALIEKGDYFTGDNPFDEADAEAAESGRKWNYIWLIALGVLLLGAVVILIPRKNKAGK